MLIAGLVPIGCLPIQMTSKFQNPADRKCIENQNLDAKIYNSKLVNLLPQIQAQLPQSHIAYADVYGPLSDMINNPTKYGKLIQYLISTTVEFGLHIYIDLLRYSLQDIDLLLLNNIEDRSRHFRALSGFILKVEGFNSDYFSMTGDRCLVLLNNRM